MAGLEFRLVTAEWERPLADFFRALVASGTDRAFHPHPLTDAQATIRAAYQGADLYYLLVEGGSILGYGMLRGWDQGYEIPSLGIALHPDVRGCGIGRTVMGFLHLAARRRGAKQVRLTVDAENAAAIALYQSLGYTLEERGRTRVGLLTL